MTVGTVTGTVGTLTVGGGGNWPMLVPVQAPSRPRTRIVGSRTGTDRIWSPNAPPGRVVSVRPLPRNNTIVARDLYEVLGVSRDADAAEIKLAYRELARMLHPDVSSREADAERFREVSEAYGILSHEESRRLYDRLGWRGRGGGIAPRRGASRVYASKPREFLQDLESVIVAAMGGRTENQPTRIVAEVELDAYEAHMGATREVELGDTEACATCDGAGRRRVVTESDSGRFVSLNDCADCGGTGEVAEDRAITVPPRSRDLDRVPVGPEAVAIVRLVPPHERLVLRLAATAALLAAIGFLLFLLAL